MNDFKNAPGGNGLSGEGSRSVYGTEEVKKTEKKDKKKRKKEGINDSEQGSDTASTRDQLGMHAYEMSRSGPDGILNFRLN